MLVRVEKLIEISDIIGEDEAKQFISDLLRDDDLGCVVRCAIHLEKRMNEIIRKSVSNPSHLPKFEYDQTVDLVVAVGFSQQFKSALKCVGSIRNRFAHSIRSDISKSDVDSLYGNMASRDRAICHELYDKMVRAGLKYNGTKKFSNLEPKDKFVLIVSVLHSALLAGMRQADALERMRPAVEPGA